MVFLNETLLQPFTFPFMQQAFVIALLIAIPAALLSCYLVIKGWSLMGDAMSHAVLPGIVLAYITGIPLAIGAFLAGLFCAVSTGFLNRNSRIKEDTVMGVVFSGMFGLGLVLYTKIQSEVHLDHILFGHMLGINWQDILISGVIALIVITAICLKWRDLMLHSFDPQHAHAIGLPSRLLHYGLLIILSLTIVSTLKAVGIILAIALLIAPGAIAFLITNHFRQMLIFSMLIAAFASVAGLYTSFFLSSDPAATIVLVMTLLFVVTFLIQTFKKTVTDPIRT